MSISIKLPFVKYSGCGNDFLIIDNLENEFPCENKALIQTLCNRRNGIGADGILLRENSMLADSKMRIFNLDGSEAEMCGNGLRCFVKWLNPPSLLKIEVFGKVFSAFQMEGGITFETETPSDLRWNIPFAYENQELIIHHINTGVPHTLLFVKNIESFPIEKMGYAIRHSWKPGGTNVTFVEQSGFQKYKVRTYERGVEGETPACGTGAIAAALAASALYQAESPIKLETLSKENLIVHFELNKGIYSSVSLTGPAKFLFRGEIDLCDIIEN